MAAPEQTRGAPPPETETNPMGDSVSKVDNSVAIGEDLAFQRRWWRFENAVWIFFAFVILCDLLGVFGRGYLAKAERRAGDETVDVQYERIERANTPSIMSVHFGASAIREGQVHLFVSTSVVKDLGAQRVVPEPAASAVGSGGVMYTFPVTGLPASIDIELAPSYPGVHSFTVGVAGAEMIRAKVAVLP